MKPTARTTPSRTPRPNERPKTPRIGLAALIVGLLMALGGLVWIAFDVIGGMRGTTLP